METAYSIRNKMPKAEEGANSDFHNYHVVRFKWSALNNKIEKSQGTHRDRIVQPNQKGKNEPTESMPSET